MQSKIQYPQASGNWNFQNLKFGLEVFLYFIPCVYLKSSMSFLFLNVLYPGCCLSLIVPSHIQFDFIGLATMFMIINLTVRLKLNKKVCRNGA